MTIDEQYDNKSVKLGIHGRLDTNTAPILDAKIHDVTPTIKNLTINLSDVEYISSAGVRVILLAFKIMQSKNSFLKIESPSDFCRQVFEATGMLSILNIE
ncbi:MAG: STAS domain-containing protein [Treponema sp.]|nr:STAS domain-containing protein [Treponema sp.]